MSKRKFIGLICLLILIDQGIKLYISHYLINKNFSIIGDYVQFKPHLNTDYSWINSLFELGIGQIAHIVVVILIILLMYIAYKFIKTKYNANQLVDLLFIFVFSGAICSLIDKVFWGGSLDYILFKGLFIFDLKDVYNTIFQVIVISMVIFNYKGIKDVSDKQLYQDFKQFLRRADE